MKNLLSFKKNYFSELIMGDDMMYAFPNLSEMDKKSIDPQKLYRVFYLDGEEDLNQMVLKNFHPVRTDQFYILASVRNKDREKKPISLKSLPSQIITSLYHSGETFVFDNLGIYFSVGGVKIGKAEKKCEEVLSKLKPYMNVDDWFIIQRLYVDESGHVFEMMSMLEKTINPKP